MSTLLFLCYNYSTRYFFLLYGFSTLLRINIYRIGFSSHVPSPWAEWSLSTSSILPIMLHFTSELYLMCMQVSKKCQICIKLCYYFLNVLQKKQFKFLMSKTKFLDPRVWSFQELPLNWKVVTGFLKLFPGLGVESSPWYTFLQVNWLAISISFNIYF